MSRRKMYTPAVDQATKRQGGVAFCSQLLIVEAAERSLNAASAQHQCSIDAASAHHAAASYFGDVALNAATGAALRSCERCKTQLQMSPRGAALCNANAAQTQHRRNATQHRHNATQHNIYFERNIAIIKRSITQPRGAALRSTAIIIHDAALRSIRCCVDAA